LNVGDIKKADAISGMFKDIDFCSACTIEIRSCDIGKLPGLREAIRAASGDKCEVILPDGEVNIWGW